MRKNGFTLIELVVVIVLIGILAGIALPRLFQSISSGELAVVQGTIMTMNSTLESIQADYLLKPTQTQASMPQGAYGVGLTSIGVPSVSAGGGSSGPSSGACLSVLGVLANINVSNMSYANIYPSYLNQSTLLTSGFSYPGYPQQLWVALNNSPTWSGGQAVLNGGLPAHISGCFYYYNAPPYNVILYYSDALSPMVGYYIITSPANVV